jgi:hypothetical protein
MQESRHSLAISQTHHRAYAAIRGSLLELEGVCDVEELTWAEQERQNPQIPTTSPQYCAIAAMIIYIESVPITLIPP